MTKDVSVFGLQSSMLRAAVKWKAFVLFSIVLLVLVARPSKVGVGAAFTPPRGGSRGSWPPLVSWTSLVFYPGASRSGDGPQRLCSLTQDVSGGTLFGAVPSGTGPS